MATSISELNEIQCDDPHKVETFANEQADNDIDNTIDVSLDIETYSTRVDAAVMSVACTCYVWDRQYDFEEWFNVFEQIKLGRHVDMETIEWHESDHPELWTDQMQTVVEAGKQCVDVFRSMHYFFERLMVLPNNPSIRVWMNSPSFDGAILKSLADRVGISLPWTFRQERDYRTLVEMAKRKEPRILDAIPKPDNAHDALVDAKHQLEVISHCKSVLGL